MLWMKAWKEIIHLTLILFNESIAESTVSGNIKLARVTLHCQWNLDRIRLEISCAYIFLQLFQSILKKLDIGVYRCVPSSIVVRKD